MKIWVDDVRQAPDGYVHCFSVQQTKWLIQASSAWEQKQYAVCEEILRRAIESGIDFPIRETDTVITIRSEFTV